MSHLFSLVAGSVTSASTWFVLLMVPGLAFVGAFLSLIAFLSAALFWVYVARAAVDVLALVGKWARSTGPR